MDTIDPRITPEMIAEATAEIESEKKHQKEWKKLPWETKKKICETKLGGHLWGPMHDPYPLPYGEVCSRCDTYWVGMGPKGRPK